MRICYLAEAGSVHTQRWVRFFAERGHAVAVLSLGAAPADALPAGTVQQFGTGGGPELYRLAQGVLAARELIARFRPDVVHAHFVSYYGVIGALAGFHPLLTTAWGSDILVEPRKSVFRRLGVQFALARADALTCDGENMFEPMRALGADAGRVHLVRCGVDTRRWAPEAADRGARAALGWPPDCPVVISLRSLEPIYDVATLVRAVPAVAARFPAARFLIAGDGSLRASLEALAIELAVADRIRFVGARPAAELARWVASATVYVSTALSDGGMPSSTLEAMACGLPVVVTDSGDNRRWIVDGTHGFVVRCGAPAAVAEKICALLEAPELRRAAGDLNRRQVVEKSEYTTEMEKAEALYRALAATAPRA